MSKDVDWRATLRAFGAEEGPRLVICRTSATSREVYRTLVEDAGATTAGWAGLHVTTLHGFLAGAAPQLAQVAPAEEPLPDGHPWKPLLEARPGLLRALQEHVARAHGARLAGVDLALLSKEIRALVEAGWGRTDSLTRTERLLREPPPAGRVLALGFGRSSTFLGRVAPLDRAVLRWLGAPAAPDDPSDAVLSKLPARRVADVIAEARQVASEASLAKGRVLVLVADSATEERVQSALARNGISAADDASSPLQRHSLGAILERLLPAFASRGTAPVAAQDLLRVLIDPMLSRRPPAGGILPVEGVVEERTSVRHVRDLVAECRRPRGTFAEWIASLEKLEGEATKQLPDAKAEHREAAAKRIVSARIVIAQVQVLARHAAGEGTLGDLGAAASEIGLSNPTDRVGKAVLQALKDERFARAEPAAFADALVGSVGSGRIDRGVQVLTYASYDGRNSDLLLLTGIHDKGVGAAPAPDPFLTVADAKVLGLPTPNEAVAERLAIVRWAAFRAGRALALVTPTDASGRSVTPPLELLLVFDAEPGTDSYGLGLSLPEASDHGAIATRRGPTDSLSQHVDAEWARGGADFGEKPGNFPVSNGTLAGIADRTAARVPKDLRPLLGEVGAHPRGTDGLPPKFVLSATRLEDFTQCLYRGFLKSVLRLEPPQEITEDLDAREVGIAAHEVLEKAMVGVHLLVPAANLQDARAKLVTQLQAVTEAAIEEIANERPSGSDSPSVALARGLLASRWRVHWERYAAKRLGSVEDAEAAAFKAIAAGLKETAEFAAAVDAIGPDLKPTPRKDLVRGLGDALAAAESDLGRLLAEADTIVGRLAKKNQENARAALGTKPVQKVLKALCALAVEQFAEAAFHPKGDLEVVATERTFGAMEGYEKEPLSLLLGRAPMEVRGSIDAVVRHRGRSDDGSARYRVIDFKTGAQMPSASTLTTSLVKPQLALYALALEAMGPLSKKHGSEATVEHVELDHIVVPKQVPAAITAETAEHARETFGHLLDSARDGRFPLVPHESGCPLNGKGYCDFKEVCRLRPTFAADTGEEVES